MSLLLARVPLVPEILSWIGMIRVDQLQYINFLRSTEIEFGDATKRLPLMDDSVEVLYCSHMLEHLDRSAATKCLREFWRVMGSGSIIRLAVPDLRKQVRKYTESGDADSFISETLLTHSMSNTMLERLRFLIVGPRHHQWMYDGDSLCRLLSAIGFVDVSVMPPGETKIHDPGILNLRERVSESVYVEGRKP
jgi:predicted SAM-dependent methyltransferase